MSDMPLFHEEPTWPAPSAARREPAVWVRRLTLVRELAPWGEVIREVTFRRGLNIIHTAERERREGRVVGHSVGKTLLLRLIRYCLGEASYCTREVKAAITLKLPDAYVMAEVHVEGKAWVVARPLGMNPPSSSWATPGEDFGVFFGERDALSKFGDFLTVLEGTVRERFEKMKLPNSDRHGRWLDLLAWLARDQSCRYRHHNEWRIPETESGTGQLRREDANLLIRMAMDLLDDEERELMVRHAILKQEQGGLEDKHHRLSALLEMTEAELSAALNISDGPRGGMFGPVAAAAARKQVEQLERLANEIGGSGNVARLDDERVNAAKAVALTESELRRLRGLESATTAEIKQLESTDAANWYASFDEQAGWCRLFVAKEEALAAGCPGAGPRLKPGERDPRHTARIEECTRHLVALASEIGKAEAGLDDRNKSLETATRAHRESQQHRDGMLRGVAEKVGAYRELEKRADSYTRAGAT